MEIGCVAPILNSVVRVDCMGKVVFKQKLESVKAGAMCVPG